MEQTWWITLLIAIIASAPGIIALFIGKRKEKADIASTITHAASELVDDLRQEVAILRARAEKYEQDNVELHCTVTLQAKQIVALTDIVESQDKQVITLTETVEKQDKQVVMLTDTAGKQAGRIDEQDKQIVTLTDTVERQALRIDEQDKEIATLTYENTDLKSKLNGFSTRHS